MRLFPLTFGLALLGLAALGLLTQARIAARDARALTDHPPQGQLLSVAGTTIHAQVMGTGPDLVLIHGASGNLRDFSAALAPDLARDFRVLLMDRPGFGHSHPLPDGDISLAGQARALRAAAEQLGAANPLLVGQSYGGSVALAWALSRPADAPAPGLVLISAPSLPWPGALDPWYRLNDNAILRPVLLRLAAAFVPPSHLRGVLDGIFAPEPVPPGYLDHLGMDLSLRLPTLETNVRQVNALRDQIVAMAPHYAARLTMPVALIHGDADTIVPLNIHAAELAPRLADAALSVLPGAGHMPHHTRLPEVAAIIRQTARRAGLIPATP